MLYSNGLPVNYPQLNYPQYYANYQPPVPSAQGPQSNPANSLMVWIQGGINGANNYLLGPNTTIPLWDSEAQVIYVKSTDATGKPSIKILDYTVREELPKSNETSFMTKDDLKDIQEKLANIETRINGLSYRKDNRKDYKNE